MRLVVLSQAEFAEALRQVSRLEPPAVSTPPAPGQSGAGRAPGGTRPLPKSTAIRPKQGTGRYRSPGQFRGSMPFPLPATVTRVVVSGEVAAAVHAI
ncbi:hypothetical protein Ssi02_63180 [Sinosporangium siamense]|uniref:Uncharacterized protein n=1 Tax=Sinosporangium siamense TaxID=1367973 RepID=A0A919RMU4_9ACTN|nr:hypothetical protein Ssi02_63180 [Sinosporangium siamense]